MARSSLPIRTDWLVVGLLGVVIVVASLVLYGTTMFALAMFIYIILFPLLTMAIRRVGHVVS